MNNNPGKPKSGGNKNKNNTRNTNATKAKTAPIVISHNPQKSTRPSPTTVGRDLLGIATFTTNSGVIGDVYQLNPGLSTIFPCLSLDAKRYDRYRFKSLRFDIIPTNGVTTTPGNTWMYFDPNVDSATATALGAILACEHMSMGPVYQKISLTVPMSKLSQWRYTRYGAASPLKLYDLGALHFGVYGTTSSITYSIECHYSVEFADYQIGATASGLGMVAPVDVRGTQDSVVRWTSTGYPLNELLPISDFPASAPVVTGSNGGLVTTNGDTVRIPPGRYALVSSLNPQLTGLNTGSAGLYRARYYYTFKNLNGDAIVFSWTLSHLLSVTYSGQDAFTDTTVVNFDDWVYVNMNMYIGRSDGTIPVANSAGSYSVNLNLMPVG
jgi:hypothetical protein